MARLALLGVLVATTGAETAPLDLSKAYRQRRALVIGINASTKLLRQPGAKAPPARAPIEATAGRVVISASKPGQLAFEDERRGAGVFTSFLLEGLKGGADLDGNGAITAVELFEFLSSSLKDEVRSAIPPREAAVKPAPGRLEYRQYLVRAYLRMDRNPDALRVQTELLERR